MKKLKILPAVLVLILVIFFTACAKDEGPEIPSTPKETEKPVVTVPKDEDKAIAKSTPQKIDKPSISEPQAEIEPEAPHEKEPQDNLIYTDGLFIGYSDELVLDDYEVIHREIMYPDGSDMVFISQKKLSDFRFIRLIFDVIDDEYILSEGESVFGLDEWNSKEPILVKTYVMGTVPDIGITFTDEDGVSRYYYISVSGDDGSLSLIEFEIGKSFL
ncbi:MAG: hypothetical protein GX079_06530 [Tissierellia bacterium]|nr:hypothetical protein [Tissierellia bacterium]